MSVLDAEDRKMNVILSSPLSFPLCAPKTQKNNNNNNKKTNKHYNNINVQSGVNGHQLVIEKI